MPAHVDIVLLTRDASPIPADVQAAIEAQIWVIPHLHRVIGASREGDAHRWETIARARNEGKKLGRSPWLMFVDDDVVLGPGCVASLLRALEARVEFAALAVDYLHEMKKGRGHWDYPRHVGMAAVLFRRERLEEVTFRWEHSKCECRCCCDDVRRAGYASIKDTCGQVGRHLSRSNLDDAGFCTGRAFNCTRRVGRAAEQSS